jgi:large subunit ribosomal protein L29
MSLKAAELRNLSDDELEEKLAEAKEELFNLRFQVVTGQLDNPMRIKQVRQDVARIMTILRERELEQLARLDAAAAGGGGEEA